MWDDLSGFLNSETPILYLLSRTEKGPSSSALINKANPMKGVPAQEVEGAGSNPTGLDSITHQPLFYIASGQNEAHAHTPRMVVQLPVLVPIEESMKIDSWEEAIVLDIEPEKVFLSIVNDYP